MRPHSDRLVELLRAGSFNAVLVVDAFRGAERRIKDLDAAEWDLRWDRESNLKSAGTMTAVTVTDFGVSMSPTQITDDLAPFGSELNILMEISSGDSFRETIQIGHFRIAETPSARDEFADFGVQQIVTASVVELTLHDRLSTVERRGFRSEENPQTTSAWSELARISGMQVIRHPSLADAVLPTDMVYKAVKGGRLQAVRAIAEILGGTEYTTPDGALSVWPYTAGTVVARLELGEFGTIIGDSEGLDSSDVVNVVVGEFETEDRQPIYAVAVASGELGPEGEYAENTFYHSNPAIRTQEAADIEVALVLEQLSSTTMRRITVTCVINPLVETGDVIEVERNSGSLIVGQIVSIRYGASMAMTVEVDVLS